MKKFANLFFLTTIICALIVSMSACGGGEKKEEKLNEKNAVGTYKPVGIFVGEEYVLHEGGTFDATKTGTSGIKGTYTINPDANAITLSARDELNQALVKSGNFFYKMSLIDCFEKDAEYGKQVSFDENGRSNQSFEGLWGDDDVHTELSLNLKEDGSFTAKLYIWIYDFQTYSPHTIEEESFEGTYALEGDVLWLSCNDTKYPMIFTDGKLYFDVLEKAE